MSVYEDRKQALEEFESRMGLERGRLAVTLDLLTDALAQVGRRFTGTSYESSKVDHNTDFGNREPFNAHGLHLVTSALARRARFVMTDRSGNLDLATHSSLERRSQ